MYNKAIMGESTPLEISALKRTEVILKNLDLTWKDLAGKKVLDAGAGLAPLAHAAELKKSNTSIMSLDADRYDEWKKLPGQVKNSIVQADMQVLPFADESFDIIVHHGAGELADIRDDVRVLKPGGEIRIFPIAGQTLEYWNITYYMDKILHKPQEEITATIERLNNEIADADGWLPKEYTNLRKRAMDTLTKEQKLDVIDLMVDRYSQALEIPFTYHVTDPNAYEPNGLLIYKKENSQDIPRKIALTLEELPELPEDNVRLVHITRPEALEDLMESGLDYKKYGMVMSMARAWSKPEEVEVWSEDPRFSFPGAKALIMDVSNTEWKLHNNLTKCPGMIPADRIVGFVDAVKPIMAPGI